MAEAPKTETSAAPPKPAEKTPEAKKPEGAKGPEQSPEAKKQEDETIKLAKAQETLVAFQREKVNACKAEINKVLEKHGMAMRITQDIDVFPANR